MHAGTVAPEKPLAEMTDEEREALTNEERASLEGAGEGEQGQPDAPPPLAIEGQGQLSMEVGGAPADESSVKMKGGRIALPKGQLDKGDTLTLLVKVRVDKVSFIDSHDDNGNVTGTMREHTCKPIGVERV